MIDDETEKPVSNSQIKVKGETVANSVVTVETKSNVFIFTNKK